MWARSRWPRSRCSTSSTTCSIFPRSRRARWCWNSAASSSNACSTLIGDALRVEQILINLVGNAVKFTSHGEVVLAIAKVAEDAASATLEFSVRDTGIGIGAAEQEHIFDAFSQGDSGTSRKYGGTGLGLAICRRMVELMGGKLSVKSALGEGSDFRFRCRFDKVAPPPEPSGKGAARALSLLIIDDNASVRAMLEDWCAAQGWHSRSADGGAAGLALLRKGWQVRIYEQSDDIRILGAAIYIWENGLRVLETLGIYEQVTAGMQQVQVRERRGAKGELLGVEN
ncbi:ATP-binding protein, partial [Janthinobacterium sp.]|uniref:ATP-binding protein n=1 Tax=Janthinobacterium sp. TaxID=1871054 RepID=UPI00338F0849